MGKKPPVYTIATPLFVNTFTSKSNLKKYLNSLSTRSFSPRPQMNQLPLPNKKMSSSPWNIALHLHVIPLSTPLSFTAQ